MFKKYKSAICKLKSDPSVKFYIVKTFRRSKIRHSEYFKYFYINKTNPRYVCYLNLHLHDSKANFDVSSRESEGLKHVFLRSS